MVLLAGMGLVIDAGYDFMQRRAMQNAADAATLAGLRLLSLNSRHDRGRHARSRRWPPSNGVPSNADVHCQYITDANADGVAACQAGQPPPPISGRSPGCGSPSPSAHRTFAMKAASGSPTSGTGATAAAQIQPISGYPGAGVPFVPCGFNTVLVDGGSQSLLRTESKIVRYDKQGNQQIPVYEVVVSNDPNTGYASIDPLAYAYDWEGYAPTDTAKVGLPKPGPSTAPASASRIS